MVKKFRITIDDIAEYGNLVDAAIQASRGKRDRNQVRLFIENLDQELDKLRHELVTETVKVGASTKFEIFDPKPRTIHAPVFRERVLHHAIMSHVGVVLDQTLVDDTFACRSGKGAIAATKRAQDHSRRFAWFGKLDIRKYFASIDHDILLKGLSRKLKDRAVLRLLKRIIEAYQFNPGKGLPIGALTSQYFANFYLNPFDRWIFNQPAVRGMARYMDDVVWWCDVRDGAKAIARGATEFLREQLDLSIHEPVTINRSSHGLTFCGYRILPATIRLNVRRKQLYRRARRKWESRFVEGRIDATRLQSGYASALAMTLFADSASWRGIELELNPPVEMCLEA